MSLPSKEQLAARGVVGLSFSSPHTPFVEITPRRIVSLARDDVATAVDDVTASDSPYLKAIQPVLFSAIIRAIRGMGANAPKGEKLEAGIRRELDRAKRDIEELDDDALVTDILASLAGQADTTKPTQGVDPSSNPGQLNPVAASRGYVGDVDAETRAVGDSMVAEMKRRHNIG